MSNFIYNSYCVEHPGVVRIYQASDERMAAIAAERGIGAVVQKPFAPTWEDCVAIVETARRHKAWLKWSLALVCLAFVIFYIPDFLRGTGANAAATVVRPMRLPARTISLSSSRVTRGQCAPIIPPSGTANRAPRRTTRANAPSTHAS